MALSTAARAGLGGRGGAGKVVHEMDAERVVNELDGAQIQGGLSGGIGMGRRVGVRKDERYHELDGGFKGGSELPGDYLGVGRELEGSAVGSSREELVVRGRRDSGVFGRGLR